MSKRVGLIACTKRKRNYPCPAEELYSESTLFRLASSYCKKTYDDWFILSAQHHLITPSLTLKPYDKTLVDSPAVEKRQWSKIVFEQIRRDIPLDNSLYFHAGSDYTKYLIELLSYHGYQCFKPLNGLGIGQQLQWYKEVLHIEPL
jgi:hypothetical protein